MTKEERVSEINKEREREKIEEKENEIVIESKRAKTRVRRAR